jgi:hypothetical protein
MNKEYKNKYLKYKNKYFSLVKNNNKLVGGSESSLPYILLPTMGLMLIGAIIYKLFPNYKINTTDNIEMAPKINILQDDTSYNTEIKPTTLQSNTDNIGTKPTVKFRPGKSEINNSKKQTIDCKSCQKNK